MNKALPLFLLVFFIPSVIADIIKPKMAITSKGIVVTCEPLAAQIGIEILRKGGNAADAFIATTLADYVTAAGYTSLSGPLYLMYFDSKSKSSIYLNAGLNQTRPGGSAYVVAGAALGLEELSKKFGSMKFSFEELVAPAEKLARIGFPIPPWSAQALASRAPLFKKSEEWNKVFTKNSKPLFAGEQLVQAKLAATLHSYGKNGSNYLYRGPFAKHLVNTIRKNGGQLSLVDLANYKTRWEKPLQTQYRSYTIATGSYRSYGGIKLLLALKTIENFKDISTQPRFFENQNNFEKLLRAYLFTQQELMPAMARFKQFEKQFPTLESMNSFLNGQIPALLWNRVIDSTISAPWLKGSGHHSCNPIVIDREGNIATGTHTINSPRWGDGLMVDGVSLNSARPVAMDAPPGERAHDGVAPVLVFKDGKPWAAAGFFARSLQPAALQVLVNLMDYGLTPDEAIFAPRFGDVINYDSLTLNLDARFPISWVETFSKKGINFIRPQNTSTYLDTGDAMVLRIDGSTGLRSACPTEKLPFPTAIAE